MTTTHKPTAATRDVWIETRGARLYACARGAGTPVLFLHGGLADHRASLHRVATLAANHLVITPDVRGSGRSLYREPLSWSQLADDVAALLRELNIERAIVGGVSAGAAIALRFALQYPKQTTGLIQVWPGFAGAKLGFADAQLRAFQLMDAHGQRALREGIEALAPLYTHLPEPIRTMALAMMRSFDPASVATTTRFLAQATQPFGDLAELNGIDAPVLIVPGVDCEHPAQFAALYAQHLPHSTLVEEPAEEAITRFCARFGSDDTPIQGRA